MDDPGTPSEGASEKPERPKSPGAAGAEAPARTNEVTIQDLLPILPRATLRLLAERGIDVASPIQKIAIPLLLKGKSSVLTSETGSGKTLAFLLPALERMQRVKEKGKPATILIMSPTRQLAVQMITEAQDYLGEEDIALVTHAATSSWQTILDADLTVATPAELNKILDQEDAAYVKEFLARVEVCVIDEFDELIPKRSFQGVQYTRYQRPGMWPAEGLLKRLIRNNERRSLQIVLASATAYKTNRVKVWNTLKRDPLDRWRRPLRRIVPPLPEDLAQLYSEDGASDSGSITKRGNMDLMYPSLPRGIQHFFWRIALGFKLSDGLKESLELLQPESALVFTCPNARESVKEVVEVLQLDGWTGATHMNKVLFPDTRHSHLSTQMSRQLSGASKGWRSAEALEEIRENSRLGYTGNDADYRDAPIMVSTEESVRGIDIDAVEAVFVLGMPKDASSYMHMAGRTGRLPHPYGQAVLVAHGQEIAKVINGFFGTTRIQKWTPLGHGGRQRHPRELAGGELQDRDEPPRGAAGGKGKRSAKAEAFDRLLR